MTEAAEKVGLKPETLLAHAMHIAAADAVVEQALRGDQPSYVGRLCRTQCTTPKGGAIIAELGSLP